MPTGEVQICRIFPNRALIGRILKGTEKDDFYEVFSF